MHANETARHACRNRSQKTALCNRTLPKTTLLASAVLGGLFALVQPVTATAQATTQTASWNLPAGPLDQALSRLAVQSKLTISYSPDLVKGKSTRGLSGAYTPTEALRRLLAGTGLTFDALNATTFVLRPAPTPTPANSTGRNAPSASAPQQQVPTSLPNVVVTGTRIPGVQPSSPLVTISQDDMRLAGDNNLGDVIRSLPENFSGGQNPGVLYGAGGVSNQNITGGSSLNLRGLGPDATLTLLNGTRLPYDGFSQATDVTVIPVAAIDHMDVLLDGASAIYGSDAVGGVANIVLKRDYDGAEITERTGGATDGGYDQNQVSFVGGSTWASGGLLVAAESDSSGAVWASQRDYLSYVPNSDLLTIYPQTSQHGVLLSGHQEFGSRVELTLDAFLTKRSMDTSILVTPYSFPADTKTSVYGISPTLRVELPNDWSLRVHGFQGEDETQDYESTLDATGAEIGQSGSTYRNQATAMDLDLEGALFALPGGHARASFGGGWLKEQYEQEDPIAGIVTVPDASNSDRYAYGEINLPVATKLSLNGALRYDDYDSFGSTTNPKIGALWNVTPSLDIRASWGTSFKAPTLNEEYGQSVAGLYTATTFGIAKAPPGATVLSVVGANPDLTPERAHIATAGIEFHPQSLPGANMELGWFNIDYTQRVVQPFQLPSFAQYGQTLNDPAYASFITSNPSAAQQAALVNSNSIQFYNYAGANYDPSKVVAIFDNRYVNAASQTVRGIDLDLRYTTPLLAGSLNVEASGSLITDAKRNISNAALEIDTAGVVAFPPKFKGRLNATWSRSSFSLTTAVNYLGGVTNTTLTPSPRGASMTTVDLIADYAAQIGQLKGLGFNVSVLNVFNRRPPYLDPGQPYFVNYDSTNYSPLGRVINVAITKRF